MVILRPSSIMATTSEPFPGWVENFFAVGHLHFPMGMGFMDCMVMREKATQIWVPCDTAANAILVTAMVAATTPEPTCLIYHCSTSGKVRFDVHSYLQDAADYMKFHPYDAAIDDYVALNTANSFDEWKRYRFYKWDLKARLLYVASKLPWLGYLGDKSAQLSKMADKMQNVEENYAYYCQNDWFLDDTEYLKVCDSLNETDRAEFAIDMRPINFDKEGRKYHHGLARYYLMEDIPTLHSGVS